LYAKQCHSRVVYGCAIGITHAAVHNQYFVSHCTTRRSHSLNGLHHAVPACHLPENYVLTICEGTRNDYFNEHNRGDQVGRPSR
jgi:hypothetical protein